MSGPVLRPAVPGDAAAVGACARAAYQLYVPRMDREPAPMLADFPAQIEQGVVTVLESDGALQGFLVMMPRQEDFFVENVAVHPLAQGQGLGRVLMAAAESAARTAGHSQLRLYTNEVMTENLVFYRRLGFVEEGLKIEDGYRRIYLVKQLT